MSGLRWTTGVGIAIGGVGGAVAALLGAPARPASPAAAEAPPARVEPPKAPLASPSEPAAPSASAQELSSSPSMSAAPSASAPAPSAPSAPVGVTPAALELPQTREALLRAQVLCDRKQQYDECSRAAESLEKGSAGESDPVQAKRFRRIALTFLVKECEAGDPHACFIMAAKYRAGTELKASLLRAEALEKRGLELCRLRRAPECPAP